MLRIIKEHCIDNHLVYYPTPSNINYFWSGGALAGLCFFIQFITGLFLAQYYLPSVEHAFLSIEHIMRDVKYGWFMRYLHANGASFFFIFVYFHVARNIFYGSYIGIRLQLWFSGVFIIFLMMATAFLGYVLPWGQMSFWGATVITNLLSVVPYFGYDLVEWLWGGFSINKATLIKFYSFHFLLPFFILSCIFIHLFFLHSVGSSNPLGIPTKFKIINFYPYFYIKDVFSFLFITIFLGYVVAYTPNIFGHPDNYMVANPMVTPSHIVPEWYFLPFYAILRSVPNKLGGVISMIGAILIFFFLPVLGIQNIKSTTFKPFFLNFLFWFFIIICFILGWLGQKPVEVPYIFLGQVMTAFYFLFFLTIPFMSYIECYDNFFMKKMYSEEEIKKGKKKLITKLYNFVF